MNFSVLLDPLTANNNYNIFNIILINSLIILLSKDNSFECSQIIHDFVNLHYTCVDVLGQE